MKKAPGLILLLFLLGALALYRSRANSSLEGPPAFFVLEERGVPVHLGAGFPAPGIHQFSDGTLPGSVIGLTGLPGGVEMGVEGRPEEPLVPGESLSILQADGQTFEIIREWMPAGQRIALGIPLHPDTMSVSDWEVLPGVGSRMAQRIEEDRQRNGAFGSYEELARVKGIGPARLKTWREFFDPE